MEGSTGAGRGENKQRKAGERSVPVMAGAMGSKSKNIKILNRKEAESTEEDVDNCLTCKARVGSGQMGLVCDGCDGWYHAECEKILKKEYEVIFKLDDRVIWFCKSCKNNKKVMSIREEIKVLKKENIEWREKNNNMEKVITKMGRRLDTLESEMEDKMKTELEHLRKDLEIKGQWSDANTKMVIAGEIRKYEEKVDKNEEMIKKINTREPEMITSEKNNNEVRVDLEKEIRNVKEEIVKKSIEEIKKNNATENKKLEEFRNIFEEMEKEKRKRNIVAFNLKESEKTEAHERYNDDEEICKELLGGALGRSNVRFSKLIRMGKKVEGKNRPLLVKLEKEEERWEILKIAKRLRTTKGFERVYLAKDLTREERIKDRNLRDELHEKRVNWEGRFIIRRGKVVRTDRHNDGEAMKMATSRRDECEVVEVGRDLVANKRNVEQREDKGRKLGF